MGNMTVDQLIEHIPPDVDKQQWIDLVHSWSSPKGQVQELLFFRFFVLLFITKIELSQAISRKGKEARRAAHSTHTCGAKSFAQIRHEFVSIKYLIF